MPRKPLAISLAAMSMGVAAQSLPQRPPQDLLPIIQMTQMSMGELKQACLSKYPDLAPEIERAHRAWVLYPVKISVLVNGKEYISPQLVAMKELVRMQIAKQDEQRMRQDCEGFSKNLDKVLERVPKEVLAPFLP